MLRRPICVLMAAVVLSAAAWCAQAAAPEYIPGIRILLEVRTPQGDLRSFQQPGMAPTYWTQDLPVVQGDSVTITPLISTGKSEVGEVKVRLDNKELADRIVTPFRVRVKTADMEPGYHLVEVWAATKSPGSHERTATTTFLLVPRNDPLLRMLEGDGGAGGPVSEEESLSCAIRSLDPDVDNEITTSSSAKVVKPALFFVAAGPAAKEFVYTLTRDGQVTYTSPKLPVPTHVLLEPRKPDGQGQEPGTLILTMRVGDGQGRFGAPAWITVNIQPAEAPK